MAAVPGGAWTGNDECSAYHYHGDTREDIDSARIPADFVNGATDGGELD